MNDEHAIRFIRTMLGLTRRKATGVLEVSCGGGKARLSFARGRLVYAEHKSLGATLGAWLVGRGLMSRADYQRVAEHVRERSGPSPMVSFVEQAVAARLLEVSQAGGIVAGQVERNVVELFGWDTFDCRFSADEAAVDAGPRFACDLEPLILQGIRARFDVPSARRFLDSRTQLYPRILGSAADLLRTFRLQPAELRVVRALNGERTVRELFESSGLDASATAHVLLALRLAQLVEWIEAPGGQGSTQESTPAPVALASVRLVKAPSVRLTLPAPPSASEIEAASSFRRGAVAFRAGNLPEARKLLAKATELIRNPEHLLYAAWVEHELAGRPGGAEAFARLADATRRALEHDATLAFGYFVVGHLHVMQDDVLNAELAFRRAAKLDPTDVRAQEQADRLRALRQGRSVI